MNCLCIDGGGSKGFYSLGILKELEAKYGPLHLKFNYIYGTSTGSIIAALISLGKSIDEIIDIYRESLPKIMNCYTTGGRTNALEKEATKIFSGKDYSDCLTNLTIVATNMQDRTPLIFKKDKDQAHGSKSSFRPGFGSMLKDAVIASSSAYPFFNPKILQTQNRGEIRAIDGGFTANNPSLVALIDMKNALKINEEKICLVSVGTGKFPEKLPKLKMLSLFYFSTTASFIEVQFESNSAIVDTALKFLKGKILYLRISEQFTDPSLACSLLENSPEKLERLLQKGQISFGNNESKLETIL